MGRGAGIVRGLMVSCAVVGLSCGGSGGGADDLPVSFPDLAPEDPGAADPGRPDEGPGDPGDDAARDDAASDLPVQDPGGRDDSADDSAADDAGADEGVADPGTRDPGPGDPGRDPGTTDPGPEAAGCGAGPACAAGTTCIDGTCDTCRFQFACGPECRDCRGTATPLCLEGACVRCRVDNDCGAGFRCRIETHECIPCADDDPERCGATCEACPSDHPQCVAGACACTEGSCGALFCIAGTCQGCDTDQACGPTCAACPGETPRCVLGTCRQCATGGDCPGGQWCDGGTCAPCGDADPAHCGTGCLACTGEAPSCESGECRCQAGSCGTGRRCADGVCQDCVLDSACGPACTACAAPTPFCRSGACRQCRTADDCANGWACGADGACMDPCAGTLGCASDMTPAGLKCSNAKVIGRTVAANSLVVDADTTDDGNNDDQAASSCWDANDDDAFKVWMRKGDALTVTATPLVSNFDMSLKIYRGTACDANGSTDLVYCWHGASDGQAETGNWTATADGWVTIVVDGESAFENEEDWGPYRMVTKLACADANCCCP